MKIPRPLLGLVVTAALVTTLGAAPAARAICTGSWDIVHQTITVGIGAGGATCGGSVGTDMLLTVRLADDGSLPDDLFEKDVAKWQAMIDALPFGSAGQKADFMEGIVAAYEDLHMSVEGQLACLPDRVTLKDQTGVNWFGWLLVSFVFEDDDCGHDFWRSQWVSKWGCGTSLVGVLGGDGGLGDGWLAAALGLSVINLQPHGGWGNWSLAAWMTGAIGDTSGATCGLLLAIGVELAGKFLLVAQDSPQ